MKRNLLFLVILLFALASCSEEKVDTPAKNLAEKEKTIKAYFSGWEKKDWNTIEKNLDAAFTFTSPNKDDHLPIDKFKAKCWEQAEHIDHVNFIRFAESGTGAYVTYQLFTKDSASFRNTEYFDFANGKIKSIEVFFGTGEGSEGFPTNKK